MDISEVTTTASVGPYEKVHPIKGEPNPDIMKDIFQGILYIQDDEDLSSVEKVKV